MMHWPSELGLCRRRLEAPDLSTWVGHEREKRPHFETHPGMNRYMHPFSKVMARPYSHFPWGVIASISHRGDG